MTKPINEIIREYLAKGDNTGWFEEIYKRAKESDSHPPWAYMQATPDLARWSDNNSLKGKGQKAIVVGCGMGDDAEFLASRGFNVTAFDVSQTAIDICKQRFPDSSVTYQQADLFHLPDTWQGHFNFVLENRTIQSLPTETSEKSIMAIANLVADNGQLLVLCNGREPQDSNTSIPSPLSRDDLALFETLGLEEQYFEDKQEGSVRRFLVLYKR